MDLSSIKSRLGSMPFSVKLLNIHSASEIFSPFPWPPLKTATASGFLLK